MDKWMDRQKDRWREGWRDGWTSGLNLCIIGSQPEHGPTVEVKLSVLNILLRSLSAETKQLQPKAHRRAFPVNNRFHMFPFSLCKTSRKGLRWFWILWSFTVKGAEFGASWDSCRWLFYFL